jgi:hypothetical protein
MPVFFDKKQTKGVFLPALARQGGYSPAKQLIIVLPLFKGGIWAKGLPILLRGGKKPN